MRDLMSWSFPIGRLFGIQIRVHILLPIVFLGLLIRVAASKDFPIAGTWLDLSMVLGFLFLSILLHEFGHCFAARWVEGDATEILMWPLGGLASCDVPHTPRANFICVICGPLVNLAICLVCAVFIVGLSDPTFRPTWNPLWYPFRVHEDGRIWLWTWAGYRWDFEGPTPLWLVVLARLFWVNWVLFLFNMVLVAFPMDAGRLLQCTLWKYLGYQRATMIAVMVGFVMAIIVGIFAIGANELLLGFLALFIYVSCRHQWIVLEMGAEDSPFGYDFSQGYTSLERDQPATAPPRRRQSWYQRWRQRRTQQKMQREQEVREAEERRLDELLEKVQRSGLAALTDEERRFLKRASDRYRNRQ
jgi:Zn-dependent protease